MSPPAKAAAILPPLSQSRFSSMSCNFRYVHTYILDSPRTESLPALRGQQVHDVISSYIRHLMATNRASDTEWLDSQLGMTDAYEESETLLRQFAATFEADLAKILGTEMRLQLNSEFEPVVGPAAFDPATSYVAYEGT